MNAKDIKTFNKFLKNHGVETMFNGLYRQYKYEDMPDSAEEHLMTCPRKLAISYAFDLSSMGDSQFGLKFWDDLSRKWNECLDAADDRKQFENIHDNNDDDVVVDNLDKAITEDGIKETEFIDTDWSGLSLMPVSTRKSKPNMPSQDEIRVDTNKKYVIVLNSNLVNILDAKDLCTMDIRLDRRTNRMVLIFGKNLPINVCDYSSGTKCVHNKQCIEYLSKYIGCPFNPQKYYYIRIGQRMWNREHTEYAIILSQKFTSKEF